MRVVKKRSERLLELLLRGAFPNEHRNTVAHAGADGGSPVEVNLTTREQFLRALAGIATLHVIESIRRLSDLEQELDDRIPK